MSLDIAALPLAFVAGVAGIVSPCVWPLVPVVVGSAAVGGRFGPYALAAGLSLSFAFAGTLLTFLLVNSGMDPEFFRLIAAGVLVAAGVVLVVPPLGERVAARLSAWIARSRWVSAFGAGPAVSGPWYGQLGIGALLGVVWLPCIGPTLGAAVALASMGQQMPMAFATMLMFGAGTGSVLLLAGIASKRAFSRWDHALRTSGRAGRLVLGWMLLLLGTFVLTGFDKALETWALRLLPTWALEL